MASPDETRVDQAVLQRPVLQWLFAWQAVRDGTPLDAYLRCRLHVYEAKSRKSFHPLPFDLAYIQGRIVRVPNPAFDQYWAALHDDGGEGGVQFMSPQEQEEVAKEAADIEVEAQDVEADLRAWREDIEKWELDEAKAIREGTRLGKSTVARLTRPRCPERLGFPWFALLGCLANCLIVLVEVFQLTVPFLDILGVDPSNIGVEVARNPVAVFGGVASAFAATVCLILLWHILVSCAVALATGWETAGPIASVLRLVGLLFLCVALFTGTLFIASLRHGAAVRTSELADPTQNQPAASPTGMGLFVFLTLLLPAGAAYIQFRIARSPYWQARAELHAQQAREKDAADQLHQPGDQQADAREIFERRRAELEERLALLEARRKGLNDRVRAAREQWHNRLKEERGAIEAYARTLHAALETDLQYFLRAAYRCQAMHLVTREPFCLTKDRISAAFTDAAGAPSQAEPAPAYRVFRPLLTDGRRSGLDS